MRQYRLEPQVSAHYQQAVGKCAGVCVFERAPAPEVLWFSAFKGPRCGRTLVDTKVAPCPHIFTPPWHPSTHPATPLGFVSF